MNNPALNLVVSPESLNQLNESIYRAVDTAVETVEQSYVTRISKGEISDQKTVEHEYASKAAVNVSIYETAVMAIASLSKVAADKKAAIAATAIATIQQLCRN